MSKKTPGNELTNDLISPVEIKRLLVIDPLTGIISAQVAVDAGSLTGDLHTNYRPDGTISTGYTGTIKGGIIAISITEDNNLNPLTGEEGTSSSLRVSRTLFETDLIRLEGYGLLSDGTSQQPSALDPDFVIFRDSSGVNVGLRGSITVKTPGVFEETTLRPDVGLGFGVENERIRDQETNQLVFDSTSGTINFGPFQLGENLLGRTPAELQQDNARLQAGIDSYRLNNQNGLYDSQIEEWQTSQQHIRFAEVFVVAQEARLDILTEGENGWDVNSWDQNDTIIQYTNSDGTELYIDRNANQAVYVRADGETDIINYTNIDNPIVGSYSLNTDGLTVGMSTDGLPLIETSDIAIVVGKEFILEQASDGELTSIIYDEQGQEIRNQTSIEELFEQAENGEFTQIAEAAQQEADAHNLNAQLQELADGSILTTTTDENGVITENNYTNQQLNYIHTINPQGTETWSHYNNGTVDWELNINPDGSNQLTLKEGDNIRTITTGVDGNTQATVADANDPTHIIELLNTDPLGNITEHVIFDEQGRVINDYVLDGEQHTIPDAGSTLQQTLADGSVQVTAIDDNGNTTEYNYINQQPNTRHTTDFEGTENWTHYNNGTVDWELQINPDGSNELILQEGDTVRTITTLADGSTQATVADASNPGFIIEHLSTDAHSNITEHVVVDEQNRVTNDYVLNGEQQNRPDWNGETNNFDQADFEQIDASDGIDGLVYETDTTVNSFLKLAA